MTVATFIQPNRTTQSGSAYPSNIDAAIAVVGEIGAQFAAHEQTVPNMTVRVDGGRLRVPNATYVGLVAAQSTGTITAPVGNNRIDRVVLDIASGAVSIVTGLVSGSPVAPAIPRGKASICSVLLTPSTTAITNSIITDERVGHPSIITLSGNWDNAGSEQVLELGSAGAFGTDTGTNNPNTFMVNNLIFDGTNWRYIVTGPGSIVFLSNLGDIDLYTALSGTAGAVATLLLRYKFSNFGLLFKNGTLPVGVRSAGAGSVSIPFTGVVPNADGVAALPSFNLEQNDLLILSWKLSGANPLAANGDYFSYVSFTETVGDVSEPRSSVSYGKVPASGSTSYGVSGTICLRGLGATTNSVNTTAGIRNNSGANGTGNPTFEYNWQVFYGG